MNDSRLRLSQAAAPCAYLLTPATQIVAQTGGTGAISVAATAGCAWSASSSAGWLTLSAPTEGTGTGTATFTAAENSGSERSATITVAGQQATVRQAGVNATLCRYTIAPESQSFPAAGGASGPITVTASATTCTWTAVSADSWIIVTSGASGTGTGSVTLTISANAATTARIGTLTVAGQIHTVSQAGAPPLSCSIGLSPASQAIGHGGGNGTFAVTAGPTCPWTATSNVGWLTLSPASGTGSGNVTFSVSANDASVSRSGVIIVGGQTFTLTQEAAPCTVGVTPNRIDAPASGQTGVSVQVTATTACGWSASSTAPWITTTAGTQGSGSGFLSFNVASNPGPGSRSATITISGQASSTSVTVNQDAPVTCTYAVTPTTVGPPAAASANQTITVTTNLSTCAWNATSNAPWLTTTSPGSGSGSGVVRYNVAANSGQGRSGTMTIAGQTVTVNQAGCAYILTPTSQHHPLAGATGRVVSVHNDAGCTWSWTAVSNVPWLTIVGPSSGTGFANVTYTVGATTTTRSGTMTIAGLTFTAFQP